MAAPPRDDLARTLLRVSAAPRETSQRTTYDLAAPRALDAVAADVAAMMRAWSLHCTHPRYFGLFNPSVHEAGVWADALAALYNPQVGAWAHNPAANEIERHVLRLLAASFGLDPDAAGAHFTTGGSEANQTAVLAALAARLPDACHDKGTWFHVDAAWGGSAALSPALRGHLAGIERADSVTWDAHKWLSVPTGAGMFFTRHPAALHVPFGVHTGYVPDALPGVEDHYLGTLQWSRRFIGLKLFMTLAERGADGVRADVERQAAMGDALRARLADAGWVVVNETPLPVVCFTHPRLRGDAAATRALLARVLAGGRTWISELALRGETVLRACITSYRTAEADVDVLVAELARALDGWAG